MKIMQAIISAFWLMALVHGVVGLGVFSGFVNLGGAGGGGGNDEAAIVLEGFTVTLPAPPTIIPFPSDFGGTNKIYKTTPDAAQTTTETEAAAIANTEVTASIAAITRAIETPTAAVNTPVASETVDTWIITTVAAYVMICPSPTTFTQGVQTYTITEATTLTITNFPCTISYPAPPAVAATPASIASVPVPVGTGLTPSGNPIIITNYTIIPSIPVANPPVISFNSTCTTFIAVTAPPPHATQPLITLGGSRAIIPTLVAETPVPVPNTPVLPTPTLATGGADRIFIGLGAAFLSGIVAVFL